MSYQGTVVANATPLSVLVLSQDDALVKSVTRALDHDRVTRTSADTVQRDAAKAGGNRDGLPAVLIVDALPETPDNIPNGGPAMSDLRAAAGAGTLILGLLPDDASFDQVRRLRAAGADEVLPRGVGGDELRAQILRQFDLRRPAPAAARDRPAGHLVAVTRARGGIGGTTIAVNLACGLAAPARRRAPRPKVVLVDLDLQFGNASVFFDLEDNGGMLEALDNAGQLDDRLLQSVVQRHASGVDVLCAPQAFMPLEAVRPETVAALIAALRRRYDHVVVDTPRAMVEWLGPVIEQAGLLVLGTDTTVPCIRQAQRIVRFFREENVGLPVRVVVNREKKALFKPEHVREAEKLLELPFDDWLPDSPAKARRAADLGRPVLSAFARSDLGKAFAKLAASVRKTVGEPAAKGA